MNIVNNYKIKEIISHPDLETLSNAFKAAGFEIRIVGGAVRDLFLGLTPKDIDLCTNATPDEMMKIADEHKFHYVPTGLQYGTITFVLNHENYEITTLRVDTETDGRHASVSFTRSFEEDAKRRDFTINAMSIDFDGVVYDYFNGLVDLENKEVRFVGNFIDRIEEDYLRVLRYFRFVTKIGGQSNHDYLSFFSTEKVLAGIDSLSGERIWSEISTLISYEERAVGSISNIVFYSIFNTVRNKVYHKALKEYNNISFNVRHCFFLTKEKYKINKDDFALLILCRGKTDVAEIKNTFKFISDKKIDDVFTTRGMARDLFISSVIDTTKENFIKQHFVACYTRPYETNKMFWWSFIFSYFYFTVSTVSNIFDIFELKQYEKKSIAKELMAFGYKGKELGAFNEIYNRTNAVAFAKSVVSGTNFESKSISELVEDFKPGMVVIKESFYIFDNLTLSDNNFDVFTGTLCSNPYRVIASETDEKIQVFDAIDIETLTIYSFSVFDTKVDLVSVKLKTEYDFKNAEFIGV